MGEPQTFSISPVTAAVPFFFLFIFIEYWVARCLRKDVYRLHDGVGSLSLGIYSQIIAGILPNIEGNLYDWIYTNYRFVTISDSNVFAWIGMFFFVDLSYYLFHRAAHEINFIWAGHIAHHSSNYYNLTTALRQGALQGFIVGAIFTIPLSFFFPPVMLVTHQSFNTLYQFWIHTELIRTLGPFEWVFNTPSHHRVHHGRNPYCIDKNYAGVLIIWDRMFGTFAPEQEEVVYGITTPLQTWDPLWGTIHQFWNVIAGVWRTTGASRLAVPFRGPGWIPHSGGTFYKVPDVTRATAYKYDREVPRRYDIYVIYQFVITVLTTFLYLLLVGYVVMWVRLVVVFYLMVRLQILAAFYDGRRLLAPLLESIMLVGTAITCTVFACLPAASQPTFLVPNVILPSYITGVIIPFLWLVVASSVLSLPVLVVMLRQGGVAPYTAAYFVLDDKYQGKGAAPEEGKTAEDASGEHASLTKDDAL